MCAPPQRIIDKSILFCKIRLHVYKAAFVVGFTGESGKELVKELIKCDAIQRLVVIGRREVQLEQGHQKVVSTYVTVDGTYYV